MEPFDLDAYLNRIGYTGERGPTREALWALHLAHATHIPFENLDILLGRPIRLDLASLQRKLVHDRRGGYCFEQNSLFAAALERLGFAVTRLGARVRLGTHRVLPRTHLLLRVEIDGRSYHADVGFGAGGLLEPIPLAAGASVRQHGWPFRVVYEPGLWVLQAGRGEDWEDLYAYTLDPQYPADLEMANHYVSTHPESRFVRTLTAQRTTNEGRHILRDRELTIQRVDGSTTRTIHGDELLEVLASTFGLTFPPETRFRTPGDAP